MIVHSYNVRVVISMHQSYYKRCRDDTFKVDNHSCLGILVNINGGIPLMKSTYRQRDILQC